MVAYSQHGPLRGISLCAGIGGIDLGLKLAMGNDYRTVCYVEGEAYCASILVARMQDGTLCDAPIWSDVKTFNPAPWRGCVDIITGGYPCQPFSCAGRRKGTDDPRHLWPYIARLLAVIQPRYAFFENVPGHVTLGLEAVATDLRAMGYDVSAGIFSAAQCGAPHIRKRLFILADANGERGGKGRPKSALRQRQREFDASGADVADANSPRRGAGRGASGGSLWDQAWRTQSQRRGSSGQQPTHWLSQPEVSLLVDGLPHRLDRVRALGNAVVPAVAHLAWRTLTSGLGVDTNPRPVDGGDVGVDADR